jgi:hypothetical protein
MRARYGVWHGCVLSESKRRAGLKSLCRGASSFATAHAAGHGRAKAGHVALWQCGIAARTKLGSSFCYLVELPGPLIDRLVKLGWLAGVARDDKAAVLAAFQRFVQQALGFSRSGGSE